jgi:membrane-bound metal-dependent hydrolase YbcI (DUF457 family)
VEPVTHALTSLALARAGQRHLPRFGTAIILAAGLAPDLDYASYLGGPGAFLRLHRSALHSLPSAALVACVVAGGFCAIDAKRRRNAGEAASSGSALRFAPALVAAGVGTAGHILFDFASGTGVQLLWPFHARRCAWNLVANLDPWILIVLAAGLLIPPLLRMISEEIGERKQQVRGRTAAVVVLAILAAYLGGRAALHSRAVDLLLARDYHGQAPLSAGAFPSSASPFEWRGVVITDNTLEEIDVPLGPGKEFDADRSITHYKPEDSPALRAGQTAGATQTYLRYAAFPLASVARLEDGNRFELHDLQFAPGDPNPENISVRIDLDSGLRIIRQQFLFAASPNP